MERLPLVSVVLPCFNAAATLRAAIQSIRQQTFPDWELIIVDDGSTDASLEIAEEAASADGRVRVISPAHVGIVEALRRGCEAARGPLIARMDADDVALPQRLAEQVRLMETDREVALCGTQVRMAGARIGYGRNRYQEWVNALVTHEEIVRELFIECPIPHPTFMMRRAGYDALGGYMDYGWAEDYDLCMRAFVAGMRFGKVAQPLLNWTESPQRLSMISPRYDLDRFRALKRHYLFQTYLRRAEQFYQWGAGEVGKAWLREWGERKPVAAVDINPRKVGRTIHGVRIIPPEALPKPGEGFTVVAVGAPDARHEIRTWLLPRGYRELHDFLFLA
jgi:glycosyltransferase involved in cell wall biosynthesis